MFGRKREKLKDGLHDPQEWELEPEEIVEINELHENARRMRCVGDKAAEMIFEDHRDQMIHDWYQSNRGGVLRYNPDADRWYEWNG